MKTRLILVLLLVLGVVYSGCDEDIPAGGLSPKVGTPSEVHGFGTNPSQVCYYQWVVTFNEPSSDDICYYRLELDNNDGHTYLDAAFADTNWTGNHGQVVSTLTVPYFVDSELMGSACVINLYEYNNLRDALLNRNAQTVNTADSTVELGAFGPDCRQCCCTDEHLGPSRWYVQAEHATTGGIYEVRCDITPRWGFKLCGEGVNNPDTTRCFTYISVQHSSANECYWAQAGFVFGRAYGFDAVRDSFIYVEVQGSSPTPDVQLFNIPNEYDAPSNVPQEFRLKLNKQLDTWFFYYQGADDVHPTGTISSTGWVNIDGKEIVAVSELQGRETDMMGVSSSYPALIDNVEYAVPGDQTQLYHLRRE